MRRPIRRLALLGRAGGGFTPASLPGLVADWPMREGAGRAFNRVSGNRTVAKNLVPIPENGFSNSSCWTLSNTAAATDAFAADPNSNTRASRLTGNAAAGAFVQNTGNLAQSAGTYTLSVYVKSNTGSTQNIRLAIQTFGSPSADLPVTTSWTRVSYTFASGSAVNTIYIRQDSGGNALDVLVWGVQLETGSSATTYEPAQFDIVPVNATWVSTGLACASTSVAGLMGSGADFSLGTFTVYAAIKQGALASANAVIASTQGYNFWSLQGTGNSTIYPGVYFNGNESGQNASNQSIYKFVNLGLADSGWHILAGSYDGTTFSMYVDGTEVYQKTAALTVPTIRNLMLGGFGQTMQGNYAYIALATSGHTAAQVQSMTAYIRSAIAPRSISAPTLDQFVVFCGDSTTGNTLAGDSWSETVAKNLAQAGRQFRNDGWGGTMVSGGSNPANGARAAVLDACLAPTKSRAVMIVFFGQNDLQGVDGLTYYANYKAFCQARTAAGWRIVAATSISGGGTGSAINTHRAVSNPLILANAVSEGWAVGVSDFASDPIMGADATSGGTPNTYYGDQLHPTVAGYAQMAPYAQAAVAAALA